MKTAHDLMVQAKAVIHKVPVSDAQKAILGAVLLIDVQEANQFATGHLPGAVHMSRGISEFKLSGSPEFAARQLNIGLYCKTSVRSALAAVQLQAIGYRKVSSIGGGYEAWVTAGKPTVKPVSQSFE